MRYFCVMLIVIFCGCKQKNQPCEMSYLKKFATQYTYNEWGQLTHKLPESFCSKVINAYQCDSSETMVYLNLIMLKMYLSHLKSNEMGYFVTPFYDLETKRMVPMHELNERNCMYYFLQENNEKTADGIYSGIGYYNVKNDATLRENEVLKTTFLKVKEYKRHLDSLEIHHPEQLN